MLLSLLPRLLLLCALAAAAGEEQQPWTLEAMAVQGDYEHPSDPGLTSAIEESMHENLETLATLELTLRDLSHGGTGGGAPGQPLPSTYTATSQRQVVAALHEKIDQVNQVLESLQDYLIQLHKQMNATTETAVNTRAAEGRCNVTTHFPCSNGTCLSKTRRCDGVVDCPGGGDEQFCVLTRALCGDKQWECLEGNQCISTYWRCDGDVDCADGSDEIDCGSHRCAMDEFECATGRCIPRNWRCDGEDDCRDYSDERGCIKAECSEAYFKCSSGDKCIHMFWRCDGESDCFDGSDESDCHKIIASCTSKEFECASHNECVPKEKVCDGAGDCQDLSDENACPAMPSKRFPFDPNIITVRTDNQKATYVNSSNDCEGRFMCATGGLCIPAEWRCDRDDDCPDSSDEVGCVQAVCRENYFRCTSGDKCIHSRWRCDGDYDCFDKSDEAGCTEIDSECGSAHFKCKLHGECVAPSKVCDGVPDCEDKSDEARCDIPLTEVTTPPSTGSATIAQTTSKDMYEKVTCGPFETQCLSGQCVARGWWCDGEPDCLDGSDELHCPKSTCSNNTLNCAAEGKCFPLELKCDGVRDCSDGSDEEGCIKRACNKKEFTCQDTGRCLPMPWKCDGQRDCLDGDDEVGCPKLQVKRCDLQRSQFACRSGSRCLSFKKVCDGRQDCVDGSDEGGACRKPCPATLCSHGCFRTPSGPQCTCPANTTLENRGISCVGGLPSPYLLVGRRDAVEAYALDGTWNLTVYEGKSTHSGVIKVANDPVEGEVYFSIVERAGIYKVDLLKTQPPQFVFDTNDNVAEAMDVDYLGRNLYIMDGMRQLLLACSLNGFICTTVLANTTSSPRSLQLDLGNRTVFWTDWKAGVVESSDMDGSSRSILASNLYWPNALAIDPLHQRVYWMEASTATLESVKYDGTDRRLLSTGTVQHVYAMDLWANYLYFTDWSTSIVYKCNVNDCSGKTPITDLLPGPPFGIKVVHRDLEVSNPCKNNTCSHICLLSATSGKGYRCACPNHKVLQKDHHTCAAPTFV